MSDYKSKLGTGAQIKRSNGRHYNFYLIEPPENADANHLAEQLITMKNVEEVLVTDGDYGFIVKTITSGKNGDNAVCNYISKRLGGNFGRATSHYQYKK